jgi:hypothetical protein
MLAPLPLLGFELAGKLDEPDNVATGVVGIRQEMDRRACSNRDGH